MGDHASVWIVRPEDVSVSRGHARIAEGDAPTPVTSTFFPSSITAPWFTCLTTHVNRGKLTSVRRAGWSGDAPADDAEAKQRIIDAAVRCARRYGIDRMSLAAIADEAGVSRPTVYVHFADRRDIVRQAVTATSDAFVKQLVAHAQQFDTAADRLVESLLFLVRKIRAEPLLTTYFRAGHVLFGPLTANELHFSKVGLGPVAELSPQLNAWIDDAADISARVMISMLTRPRSESPSAGDERSFLHRWYPQALGITDGE